MVQLIIGQKGKGKTTAILSKVNEEIKTATGNIVFLDKDSHTLYFSGREDNLYTR